MITFDEKLEAAWGLHKIEKAVLEKEIAELRAENEKLRNEVMSAFFKGYDQGVKAERERCAKIAEQARDDTCDGPVAWSMADSIAAAIRESGDE